MTLYLIAIEKSHIYLFPKNHDMDHYESSQSNETWRFFLTYWHIHLPLVHVYEHNEFVRSQENALFFEEVVCSFLFYVQNEQFGCQLVSLASTVPPFLKHLEQIHRC